VAEVLYEWPRPSRSGLVALTRVGSAWDEAAEIWNEWPKLETSGRILIRVTKVVEEWPRSRQDTSGSGLAVVAEVREE